MIFIGGIVVKAMRLDKAFDFQRSYAKQREIKIFLLTKTLWNCGLAVKNLID